METLDFVEKQAERLAAFRLETMETLNKRAHAIVTLLLGAAGGAAVFALNTLSQSVSIWITRNLAVAAVWLFMVAAVVVCKCLLTGITYPPGEEPVALLAFKGEVNDLREGCLRSLEQRTKLWADRNTQCGIWLNYCYLAAIATPLVSMTGAACLAAVANLGVPV